ncbi:MAG: TetR/AcrR family transcriptional regulator [Actinobacteria bacterium]|nr:TetR/AcrR family transcriptional regulator [Actinomycetota bacterium]
MRVVPEGIAERLEAAAQVFADHGFDQTRIEDLAEATGIPRATLYYYFAGKEDILAWLLRRMLAEVTEAVAVGVSGEGTAHDRLVAVVRAKLEVMARHPATCRALIADLGRAGRIPDISAAIQLAFHHPVRRLLADGEADGTLRPVGDPETTASAVYGAITTAANHYLVADNRLDTDRVATEVTTFLLAGLCRDCSDPSVSQTTDGGRSRKRG